MKPNQNKAHQREKFSILKLGKFVSNDEFFVSKIAQKEDWILPMRILAISTAVFLTLIPFTTLQIREIPAFIASYEAALVIVSLITAVFLYAQFYILGMRALFALVVAYLFSAFIAIVHALSFPRLFTQLGWINANEQTTAWLYMMWHLTFPILVIIYALSKGSSQLKEGSYWRQWPGLFFAVSISFALVVFFAWLTTSASLYLPSIMIGDHYSNAMIFVVSGVCAFSALASLILWLKTPRSVLDIWLIVVSWTWVYDIALSAVFNHGRYDLGFYAGRIFGLISSTFVLLIFLIESTRLYGQLALEHLTEKDLNIALEAEVARRMRENEVIQDATIRALARLAEIRDQETGFHILRTSLYVKKLAELLQNKPKYQKQLSDATITLMAKSAPLHDIGKVGIPDAILRKPGKLDPQEWEVMKTHAQLGAQAIERAEKDAETPLDFLAIAKEIAHWHHEKWDGSGYPDGLKWDEIPLSAKLMALADVFDALVSKRVYKEAFTYEDAKKIIAEGRGKHFDPDLVDVFIDNYDQFIAISMAHKDAD